MTPKRKTDMESPGESKDARRIPSGPPNMEKLMADISRILEEQEFDSIEEANAFLAEMVASGQPIPSHEAETPLEEAQELVYEAWDSRSRAKRLKLAKQALKISADCADAYLILAEEERNPDKAVRYLEQGVAAGERAIGPEQFEELEGSFWGVLETRPYMRLRLALATFLSIDQMDAAIEHYRELLRLNPNDNQGVRYLLLAGYLTTGRYDEADELLRTYDEATAICTYTDALLMYRRFGPTRKTKMRLKEAISCNPFVPAYILGEKRVPLELPDYVSMGGETEAISYTSEFAQFWYQLDGALDWLRKAQAEKQ